MGEVINRLAEWVRKRERALRQQGVAIGEKIPTLGSKYSNVPWKAGVDFAYDGILVDYTIWERDIIETSLIVMNLRRDNQTIIMTDKIIGGPEIIESDLEDVVRKLLDHTFLNMRPDPKLVVTRMGSEF